VLPFTVSIRPGRPLHDQLVFAVTKAVIIGQLRPGDEFPSVRTLSRELGINPNTAMKALATLVERGLLDARPGIGTFVAARRPPVGRRRGRALAHDIERLVVDAKRLGIGLSDVLDAIRKEWK
jgi:GntR family transcriptional regulator